MFEPELAMDVVTGKQGKQRVVHELFHVQVIKGARALSLAVRRLYFIDNREVQI